MWIDADAARSDFILAAAAYVLVPILVRGLLVGLPFYPSQPTLYLVLSLLWIWVAAGLTPTLLAGYRDDGAAAFGLDQDRSAGMSGLVLALPIVAVGILRALPSSTVADALLGRFSGITQVDPTVSQGPSAIVQTIIPVVGVGVLLVSAIVLLCFLSVRAEGGFRGPEMGVTQALRTFGIGAAGLGLVLGLLNAVRGAAGWQGGVFNAVGLAVLVLLADRIIPPGLRTTRTTILAPAIVVLTAFVFVTGGILSGDLLAGLYGGSLAGGLAIVVASLVVAERTWAVVPLLVAAAVYPTCMTPIVPPVPEPFLPFAGC